MASDTRVRVLDGNTTVAEHTRSWDRGRQIEDERHLGDLAHEKRHARDHRGRNRLIASCPSAQAFLEKIALHGVHLGGTSSRLLRLLDDYGPDELEFGIAEALRRSAFAAQSVAHILDQRRRAANAPVPIPVVLPSDPRVRDLRVDARSLAVYDALAGNRKDHGDE